jgi:hypothetical protein
MEQDGLGRVKIITVLVILFVGLVVGLAYYFNYKNVPPAAVVEVVGGVKDVVPVNSGEVVIDVGSVSSAPSSWLVKMDSAEGISFQYPEKLDLEYYRFVNDSTHSWPPQVRILDGELVCKTGKLGAQNVSVRTIDGVAFCLITGQEAGMSQLWRSLVYAFNFTPDKVVEFSFTVHSTNGCGVYDDGVEPNTRYKKCLSEEAIFTPAYMDAIVGKMAKSVKEI